MAEPRNESATFAQLTHAFIESGQAFRFQAQGRSMTPTILDGEVVHVEPLGNSRVWTGDIVLYQKHGQFKAHRVVRRRGEFLITRGDAGIENDDPVCVAEIVGRVVA